MFLLVILKERLAIVSPLFGGAECPSEQHPISVLTGHFHPGTELPWETDGKNWSPAQRGTQPLKEINDYYVFSSYCLGKGNCNSHMQDGPSCAIDFFAGFLEMVRL